MSKPTIMTALFALWALTPTAQADDRVPWTGPGWYLAQSEPEAATVLLGSSELIAGPYPTEDACQKAKPQGTIEGSYSCISADMPDFTLRTAALKPKPAASDAGERDRTAPTP